MEKEAIAAALVAAVKKKGSDAQDARDAAHEACHALEWGVSKKWTRNNIHAKKPKGNPSFGVASEILARAVEALVCRELGIAHDVDQWAFTCWMEMLKNERISLPTDFLAPAIKSAIESSRAKEMAARVLALAEGT